MRGYRVVTNRAGTISSGYGFEDKAPVFLPINILHRFGPWPLGYNGPVDKGGPQAAPVSQLLVMGGIQRVSGKGPFDPVNPAMTTIKVSLYLELTPFQSDQDNDGGRGAQGNTAVRIPIGDGNQLMTDIAPPPLSGNPAGYSVATAFPIGPAAISLSMTQFNPNELDIVRGFALWSVVPLSWRPRPSQGFQGA